MFCRSVEKKNGMRIPERVKRMQENMMTMTVNSNPVQSEKLTLIRDGFEKGLSKIDIGKMVATK